MQASPGTVPVVHSLERAARILFAFSVAHPALRLGEIARQVELSKSTTRRLLLTLERLGLVTSDPAAGLYRLGIRCLELGMVTQVSIDLRARAMPVMQRLVEEVGETVYLMIPRGTDAVCIEIAEAWRGVRVLFTGVGTAFPLHVGAAPRALLAALPPSVTQDVIARGLAPYTPGTITDREALMADIERTRLAGYALSREDLVPGIAGIGAVVRDHRDDPAAAISISGLKERFGDAEIGRLSGAVMGAAAEISRSIGGTRR